MSSSLGAKTKIMSVLSRPVDNIIQYSELFALHVQIRWQTPAENRPTSGPALFPQSASTGEYLTCR